MATIREVAKRANASIGTVSHVLNGKVPVNPALKARILLAIEELNYTPNHIAQSLASRRSMTLGMVIPDITNPFFPNVVRGAEDAAFRKGYSLLTFNTDDHFNREQKVLSVLRSRRADGIILVGAQDAENSQHIEECLAAGIPIVCLDRIPSGLQVDSIAVDNPKGMAMCVRHLLARGHRRIGLLTGDMRLQTARERYNGFETGLTEFGYEVDADLVRNGDFRRESGYRLTKQLLLGAHRPTAILCSNGMMAIGAVEALHEIGVECPSGVALASFDDLPFATLIRPRLTSIAQPEYDLGARAAELLLDRLGNTAPEEPVHIRLEPELRVRESTSMRVNGN